jgi:hypothetical protein
MNGMAIRVGAVMLAVTSTTSVAQTPAEPVAATKIDSRAVVADVRQILAENYVLADLRPKLDDALAKGLASGRYNVTDPAMLAQLINADLGGVAHDKHLGMHYDPNEAARLASRPPGAGADDAPPSEEEVRQASRFNFGIMQMKVLPGNIRYVETLGFFWAGSRTAEAYDNAMRFLRDGDAAIIDLRNNGGGSPEAVQYMISHFVKASQPIVTFYMGAGRVKQMSALASLPAGRLVGKPLYILTSDHTASAAEEFTGHVAGFELGEVIGSKTAGAGFRNEFFPVAEGYVISVSVGRAVLASTGKDWEGVGIAPTTEVAPDKALEVAQIHALKKLAASASGRDRQVLEARAGVLEAQLDPVATALQLDRYAGTYGERLVTVDGGALHFQRQGGPKVALVAVAANEFSFAEDPTTRVRFTVAGEKVTSLELVRGDGSRVQAERQH